MQIRVRDFLPTDTEYIMAFNKNARLSSFVTFIPPFVKTITVQERIVGFYHLMQLYSDEDYEVSIGLFEEYQNLGIASYVLSDLMQNVFQSTFVKSLSMQIDVENAPSLALASHLGFVLESELLSKSDKIVQWKIYNPNYIKGVQR